MRVCVISSAPRSWRELTDITWPALAKYCKRHGYDLHTDVSEVTERVGFPTWGANHPEFIPIRGFIKLDLFMRFMEYAEPEYDYLVWLDADCLITNFEKRLDSFLGYSSTLAPCVTMTYDYNGHNATYIAVSSDKLIHDYLWACRNAGWRMFGWHDWGEMEAMLRFSQAPPYKDIIRYVSVQELCALPPNVYPTPKCIAESYEWTPDSLSVHFSALSIPERVRLAREWAARA
jgi:hypothetical protein